METQTDQDKDEMIARLSAELEAAYNDLDQRERDCKTLVEEVKRLRAIVEN